MKSLVRLIALVLAAAMVLMFAACGKDDVPADTTGSAKPEETTGSAKPEETTGSGTNPEENYDGRLVFDHAMELRYAKAFSVDCYKGGYKMITVTKGSMDGSDLKMLVVPEGMSVPAGLESDIYVLQQPVTNILVSSTPTTSLFHAIGTLDAISLTTYDVGSWYIEDVKALMNEGKMTYIGDYKTPDYEKIVTAGTTFAIFSTMLTEDVAAQLDTLGVKVMLDQAASEDHPLARVEWAKLYGAIFNKEEEAEAHFNAQSNYVDEIAKREATGKSVAIFYITSKGVLYARNSDDYMAKMVALAGGEYVLDGKIGVGQTGTAKMEMEAFYDGAKDADYIIYVWTLGGKPETLSALLERGDFLADMKAVKEGNVWCTTPDFFQISSTLGNMINDINLMLNADDTADEFTYLFKLK